MVGAGEVEEGPPWARGRPELELAAAARLGAGGRLGCGGAAYTLRPGGSGSL
jgi:hypothetical protein